MRIFNPTWKDMEVRVTCYRALKAARLTNLNEEPQQELAPNGNSVEFVLPKKRIFTLELTLG
jgi:alpha-mannosidase